MSAERKPGIARDRAHLDVEFQGERVEARRAFLNLGQGERAGLELEAGMVEQDLLPRAPGVAHVTAAQVEVAWHAEERRQRA